MKKDSVLFLINKIKTDTNLSPDIKYRTFYITKKIEATIIFCDSIVSSNSINEFISKSIVSSFNSHVSLNKNNVKQFLSNTIYNCSIIDTKNYEELISLLFSGFSIIITDNHSCLAFETKGNLDRSISESSSEITIQGPKDSFNENYMTNIGLIRKRIKDENLFLKELTIGRSSKSLLGILYMNNIADYELVLEIYEKLKTIDIDGVIDTGYIKEFLSDDFKTTFPTILGTEKPDLVAGALLEGKVVIILENTPYVLILPTFFIDFFHAPEDYYQKSTNVSMTRIIRVISFFIAILAPACYVALITYNPDILPPDLFMNFAIQTNGVPFPPIVEALLLFLTFEIIKESDTRTPSAVGSALSIVGALVLGDAAVNAGIVSPIMVIIIAISSISGLAFASQDMVNSLRFWRILFMIAGFMFGFIGIFILLIYFVIRLCDINLFKKPYLFPFAPLYITENKDAILRFPRPFLNFRTKLLSNNTTRIKKENNI